MKRFATVFGLTLSVLLLPQLFPPSARGEEIQLGVAPSNPAKAGFTLFVLSERLGNEGFQPITLRFRAIGKSFARQRQLRIQFRPRTQYATEIDFQFAIDVTVPQGVKTHDIPILVPHFYRWETCSVQVFEDGRRVGRTPTKLTLPGSVKDWGQRMSIGVMVPRDAATSGAAWAKFPDLRSLATVLGDGPITEKAETQRFNNKQARNFVDNVQAGWAKFRIIDEDVLQSSWLGYSQLDLILAPYPMLMRIEREQPDRMAEIKRWVSAGGQLWAYAAPPTPQATQQATQQAAASKNGQANTSNESPSPDPPTAASQSQPTVDPAGDPAGDPTSWLAGNRTDANQEIRYMNNPRQALMLGEINDTSPIQYQPWNYGSYSSGAYMYGSNEKSRRSVYEKLEDAKHPMVQTVPRKQLVSDLEMMHYGFGRVVLIKQQDPFPGSFQFWQSLEILKQNWDERNGISYSTGNDSYWAWLMAAVGQPPVTMFVILNGLFVLVMGPVLYFTLRRRSRLYLLYFLAPTLAFLVTMGLFSYAFVSDGFSNRARIRQLTWIDGKQPVRGSESDGERFPWIDQSRQTYYTVVDNQRGLRFRGDTFVLPVLHSELINNYSYYMADDRRSGDYLIDQVGNERIYSGDFLPTRTQVHYLATRPSVAKLPIEVELADGVLKLTNRLTTTLSEVRVCDENGKYWIASTVASGATVELENVRGNAFSDLALRVVDPDSTDMPTPYRDRVSLNDRTLVEDRILKFSRSPPASSFLVVTEVDQSQFALRDCAQEDCIRLIGGLLP